MESQQGAHLPRGGPSMSKSRPTEQESRVIRWPLGWHAQPEGEPQELRLGGSQGHVISQAISVPAPAPDPSHLQPQPWQFFLAPGATLKLGDRKNDLGLVAVWHIFPPKSGVTPSKKPVSLPFGTTEGASPVCLDKDQSLSGQMVTGSWVPPDLLGGLPRWHKACQGAFQSSGSGAGGGEYVVLPWQSAQACKSWLEVTQGQRSKMSELWWGGQALVVGPGGSMRCCQDVVKPLHLHAKFLNLGTTGTLGEVVPYWGAAPCTERCLATSLASTY